ncbi:MAG: T9SS type A sorting domain-containing protein [Psychroserpens sp.]|uniref:T9SS type A sorting domain-containing protein n=1 Tax=Psychroserpens sp. TaxID=2020870 RepID=UPI003C70686D
MKKITFILCFLVTSFCFSQVLLEDFDGVAPTIGFANGPGSVAIVETSRAGTLRIITDSSGQPWQQAELVLQNDLLDMSTTDKVVAVDYYSTVARDIMLGIAQNTSANAPTTTAEAAHGGTGWETLNFNFNNIAQVGNIPTANNYGKLFFFPHWNIGISNFNNPITGVTTYVDIIQGPGIPAPAGVTNWTGSINTDWFDAANWDNGLPSITTPANIPSAANSPTSTGPVTVSDITIESGGSFIANSTVSGALTYRRNLSTSNWHYIASPVEGQNIDAFVTSLALESQGTFSSFCAFETGLNNWVCYEDMNTFETNFISGKGYIVNLLNPSGAISFTGTMNVDNETIPLDSTGSGYNLLGNPYPSFIDTNAMLSVNSASLATETIWVWDASTSSYVVYVTADDFKLAPGQGFFVQSNGSSGNVTINEAFQSHENVDSFLRTSNNTEVRLTLTNGLNTRECRIYYLDGATTGFDNGYDGPMFRAFSDPFSIYTHLITDGVGTDMGVQSLPNNNYDNLIVPIGINAASNTEISISASVLNIPFGINLYLEDRDMNTFTLLDSNSQFNITLDAPLNGTGRFYLHTSSSTLNSTDNILTNNLQIYVNDASTQLTIEGRVSSKSQAEIYDIQGKLLLREDLKEQINLNLIDISSLHAGLYIINIYDNEQSTSKKIVIK